MTAAMSQGYMIPSEFCLSLWFSWLCFPLMSALLFSWLHAAKVVAAVPALPPHLTVYAMSCCRIKQLPDFNGLHQQKIIFNSLYISTGGQLWLGHTVFIAGRRIWDIASVMTVQGKKEYSGNTWGFLMVLLRHGTHVFLLYVIGQSK